MKIKSPKTPKIRASELYSKNTPFKPKVVELKNKYTRKVKHKKGEHDV